MSEGDFYQRKTYCSPDEFAHSYEQGEEDSGAGCYAEGGGGHKETAFATAKLQRDEEQ